MCTVVCALSPSKAIPVLFPPYTAHPQVAVAFSVHGSSRTLSRNTVRPLPLNFHGSNRLIMFSLLYPTGAFSRCRICIDIISAHDSSTMVIRFSAMMKMRENIIFVCLVSVPFTTSMGLTLDSTMAGMKPASRLTTTTNISIMAIAAGLVSVAVSMSFPIMLPAYLAKLCASTMAMAHDMAHIVSDSQNILMPMPSLEEPKRRRVAISLAR